MSQAEDFLQDHPQISHFFDDKTERMVCFSDDVQKAMMEFAAKTTLKYSEWRRGRMNETAQKMIRYSSTLSEEA